ncbi:AraC family transcriptional regulator [Paenibacillus sp. 32352]|uniref:AraC family transcriptional regulator n=1 Tax=Paenibacillus sp. 32352 TaxID=1969111 RepID=UPI0015C4D582|nr:AraC family transcriptional regulator [Paenibacillus sp. 32352]
MQEYANEFADLWLKLPSPLLQKGGMRIVRAGRNEAKPTYRIGPKIIECHSLHFILEGELTLEYAGKQASLNKGDLFCLFPYTPYLYSRRTLTKPLRMVWLALDGEQVPEAVQRIGLTKASPYLKKAVDARIKSILHRIIGLQAQSPSKELAELSELYRLFDRLTQLQTTPATETDPDWLDKSIEYLQLHYTEPLKIEELARFAGVNRTYFSTQFHRKTGAAPMQYLQKLRMDKASQLLRCTSLAVTEIAFTLGYPDLYSFTRAFKNYYGASPSSYRNSPRETPPPPV